MLFNWYYYRPDLTRHLLEIGRGHDLFFIDRHSSDGVTIPGSTVLYWGDYSSPYALLAAVRPDKVVFSDIESFPQIALNIAARNMGIPTVVLQHGANGAFQVYRASDETQTPALSETSFWTMCFLAKALRPRNAPFVPALMKFVYDRKRFALVAALRRNRHEFRLADLYIDFSAENAGYFKARDHVPDDRFVYIGNPAYDEIFKRAPSFKSKNYALLIDAPFLEAGDFAHGRISSEDKARYLEKLDRAFALRNMPLRVKLHPLSYDADLPDLPNTEYIREADIVSLIGQCEVAVLVHFSTLSAPVLHLKPFHAFTSGVTPETPFLEGSGLVRDLSQFDPEALGAPNEPLRWRIVKDYLFSTDGKARDRLHHILFGGRYELCALSSASLPLTALGSDVPNRRG
jgi:hypothetical protein